MKPIVRRPTTIKLVILYILNKYRDAIPERALSNMMVDDINVNYFDYRQALSGLEEVEYVHTYTNQDVEYHALTEEGNAVITEMHKKIAYQLRQEISNLVIREKIKIIQGKEFECDIVPISDVCFGVSAMYREADQELLSISFKAGDRKAAEAMVQTIRANKDAFYMQLNSAISETLSFKKDDE